MYTNKPIYFYSSALGNICVVPAPRFQGIKLDKDGKPWKLEYITNRYYQPIAYYDDLKGLNIEDYEANKPALVVYELADGSLLAATPAVFEKATRGSNNACSRGSACYVHQVSDLELIPELPISKYGCPGLPVFQV